MSTNTKPCVGCDVFTEDEVATMRALYAAGARYIARDEENDGLWWYSNKPKKHKSGFSNCFDGAAGEIPREAFTAVPLGASITIADIIGRTET